MSLPDPPPGVVLHPVKDHPRLRLDEHGTVWALSDRGHNWYKPKPYKLWDGKLAVRYHPTGKLYQATRIIRICELETA